MEPLTLRLKNFLYFLKKSLPHFSAQARKNKKVHPEKKLFIFQEMEPLCSNIKKV